MKGMDAQGALQRWRETAGQFAEAIACVDQLATCAMVELGEALDFMREAVAAATYTTCAVLEELSEVEKAWDRAKAAAKLHRAQRKRRRAIEGRFRAEIRWAESLRFYHRIFRPPRRCRGQTAPPHDKQAQEKLAAGRSALTTIHSEAYIPILNKGGQAHGCADQQELFRGTAQPR